MIKNVDIKGLWWLPENPEYKVAGMLHHEPMGKTKLDLIGEFRPNDWLHSFNETKGEDVIWGLSSENKAITLFQNFPFATKNSSCPFSVMHYDCQFLIIGKHIRSLKEEGQYRARILFDELSYWYRPDIVKFIYKEKEKDIGFISSFNSEHSIDIRVTDNIKFSFEPQISVSQEDMGLINEMAQSTDLVISFTMPTCLQFILNVVKEFELMLSIATLSHVQCKGFNIYDESRDTEEERKQKIEIMHHYFREEYKPNKKFYNYLFTYDTVKEQLSNVLQKWYETEDIMPIRSHLVDSLNRHGVFSSTDFLVVVQAIEGFYCRFRQDNESLRNILRNLVTEFSDIRCVEMEEDDYQKIADSRHYYSHLLPPGKKPHVVQGKELYNLDFKLRKILLCCVLNFMGFDNSTIDMFVAKSNNHFLDMINKQKNYVKVMEEPITLNGDIISSTAESEIEEKGVIQ